MFHCMLYFTCDRSFMIIACVPTALKDVRYLLSGDASERLVSAVC